MSVAARLDSYHSSFEESPIISYNLLYQLYEIIGSGLTQAEVGFDKLSLRKS